MPDAIDGKQLEADEELAVQWKNFWSAVDFETIFEQSDFLPDQFSPSYVPASELGYKLYELYWNHRREHFGE